MDEETKAAAEFCDAAEALIATTTEVPVLSEQSENAPCPECRERQANALLRELALRHDAEARRDEALVELRRAFEARQAAEAERDAALAERDARVLDERLRAQRVDVEALRAKVELMRKNLAAVDARADERFTANLRAKDAEVAERIAAVRAEVQPAIDELTAVRAGEQARVTALNAAMELIWASGRRDKGAPRNDRELVVALTQVLSIGGKEPQ